MCTRIPEAADSAATASSSVREHDTAKRGASAMRMRPPAWPCQRRCRSSAGVDAGAPVLVQPGGGVAAVVHQALADRGADAGRGQRLEHGVGVVHGLHREHRRRAGPQQLVDGEARRRGQRRRRVRRFERPHAPLQPLEQRQVVGQPPEEGLAQVDVRLDEAGEEVAAVGVDLTVGGRRAGAASGRPG